MGNWRRKYLNSRMIMLAVVFFLMTGGLFGFVLSATPFASTQQDTNLRFNGVSLQQSADGFIADVDGREFIFTALPYDVDYLTVDAELMKRLRTVRMMYVTSSPNSSQATAVGGLAFELAQASELQGGFVQVAFTGQNPFSRPVITCSDATPFVPVIYVQEANNTRMYREGDCLVANASSPANVLWLKDRLVYGLLGVIE